jgi:hypothetical protein
MEPKEDVMSHMWRRISFHAVSWGALALLAVGALALGSEPVSAQGAPAACGARDGLLSQLESKYGEVPVAIGVTGGVAGGALVELLTDKEGLTWTLILTTPQGLSCLIASGEGWRPLAPVPADPSV